MRRIGHVGARLFTAFLLLSWLAACTPMVMKQGDISQAPKLTDGAFITGDGMHLALRSWAPETRRPQAVILALHGFNDYSNFFDEPGGFLAQRFSLLSYAYDQRGFGANEEAGGWAGVDTYADDLGAAARAVKARHPDLPLFVLGASMGGAVILVAEARGLLGDASGVILSAPAVWGRITMPWYQRAALWFGAHTLPWWTVTGEGLNIKPSDNIEMLIELGRDPLVIKHTRIGTIYGLANLMDAALEDSGKLRQPALILYGERDEIIPKHPTRLMLERVNGNGNGAVRVALYEGGYHMLLRDLPASMVWKDIAAWIGDRRAPLPSKADQRDVGRLLGKD